MNRKKSGFRDAFENFLKDTYPNIEKRGSVRLYENGVYICSGWERPKRGILGASSIVVAISDDAAQMHANLDEALKGED